MVQILANRAIEIDRLGHTYLSPIANIVAGLLCASVSRAAFSTYLKFLRG